MLTRTEPASARSAMYNENRLKIGFFGTNCSSGRTITRIPERWSGNWEDNLTIAKMADDAGIDFLLPIARWKGYRGETNFHGAVLETITWACGLLAKTKRIHVFGTVHAPLVHPVFAAKQFATVDLVSEGRFGLNMVAGWNKDEFDMFGREQHEHDVRYDYAQEWVEVIKMLWTQHGTFDYHGRFFELPNLYAEPKPYGGTRPIIMNAGASPRGRAFAFETSDMLFTLLVTLEQGAKTVAEIKAEAAERGRDVDVYTSSYTVVRPTRAEAEEYHRYYVEEQADWEAFEHLAALQFPNPEHRASKNFEEMKKRFIGGNGSYPFIGSPDDVAAELARVHEAGYTGIVTSFVNYVDEFPYFRQEVLPRLARLGLREAA